MATFNSELSNGFPLPISEAADFPKKAGHVERATSYIKLVGLPFNCSLTSIKAFVGDVQWYESGKVVFRTKNAVGGDSGKAFIRLANEKEAARRAESLHKQYLGHRYIEVYHIGPVEATANGLPLDAAQRLRKSARKRRHESSVNAIHQVAISPGMQSAVTTPRSRDSHAVEQRISPQMRQVSTPPRLTHVRDLTAANVAEASVQDFQYMDQPPRYSTVPRLDDASRTSSSLCSSTESIGCYPECASPCACDLQRTPSSRSGWYTHNPYQQYSPECPA